MPVPREEPTAKRPSKKGSKSTGATPIQSAPRTPPPDVDLEDDVLQGLAVAALHQDEPTGLALAVKEPSPPPFMPAFMPPLESETNEVIAEEQVADQESDEEDPGMDAQKLFHGDDNAATAFETLCSELSTYRSKLGANGTAEQSVEGSTTPSSSNSCLAFNDDLKVAEHIAKTRGLPPDMASVDVPPFLLPYGYDVRDHKTWARSPDLQPKVQIELKTHIEFGDHTQYEIICKLYNPNGTQHMPSDVSWRTLRRLKHIRVGLHDVVKQSLGSKYKQHFGSAPFAHRSAPAGTTARVRAWLNSLSNCINSGSLAPAVVAMTFRLLDGPGTPLYAEGKSRFYTSAEIQTHPVTAAMFGSKDKLLLPRVGLARKDSSSMPSAKKPSSDELGDKGYVEMVFLADGQVRPIRITRKPFGVEFCKRHGDNLKAGRIQPDSHAAELGIQVGWEVKSLDGEDISLKSFAEASSMIRERVFQLPSA